MAIRSFNSPVQRISIYVPGCPHPVIEQFVRDAAIKVCERTLAWRYEQPPIRLTPGVYDYPYEVPQGAEVHAFLSSSVNGMPIMPVTIEEIHQRVISWPSVAPEDRSRPRFVSQLDVDNFIVAPAPDDAEKYDLKMVVALKPLRTASGMDQTALDDLEDAIKHGALERLLTIPDKSWSDNTLATYHARQFLSQVTERRARANLGAGRASMSVKMNPLA